MFDAGAQSAFLSVTAASMTGVPQSALTILSFASTNTTRRLSYLRSKGARMKFQSSPAIKVEYSTATTLESFGSQYSSVDEMISALNTQVVTSFADPATASEWVAESVAQGSTTITSSTTVAFGVPAVDDTKTVVVVVSTWPPTFSPTSSPTESTHSRDSGSDDSNTDTLVVLVVVPIVGGLLLISLLVCGFFWLRKRTAPAITKSTDSSKSKSTFGKAPVSKDGLDTSTISVEKSPLGHNKARSAPVLDDDRL